jgi:hypothetical protein
VSTPPLTTSFCAPSPSIPNRARRSEASAPLGSSASGTIAYPTDLTDGEWALLEPLIAHGDRRRGRPRLWPARRVLDAIFYVLRSSCAWRLLPHDFPPWQTV